MIHISDIKKYTRCPKIYWNSCHLENEPYFSYVRMDEAISDLVIKKLWVKDPFIGQRNDPHERAFEAAKNYEWLVKARFNYNDIRIKVPFMHKVDDQWDIYFVVISVLPKDEDIQYYCHTIWVLLMLGFKINEIYIIHLNKDYVRDDELDIQKLFKISELFYNAKGKPTKNITKHVLSKLVDLTDIVNEMKECTKLESCHIKKSKRCVRRVKCMYYDDCFFDENELEDDSILTLVSSQHKNELFQENIRLLKDAPLEKIEGSRQQYAQIMASRNDGIFVDKNALQFWLSNSLKYPYSFLDFEWETYAVPPYRGLRPFDVSVFAYSLHVLDENENCTHQSFMGIHDCREELILKLLNDLPTTGSIIAYNGDGAEKIRLQELARQFPKYKRDLEMLCERIVDLSHPFLNGLVYDIRMRGMYSLKVLHSLLDNTHTYKDLEIHNGMDAVFKWRSLDKSDEENEEIKNQLMEYCTLDTYAMVLVVKWLYQLIEQDCST